MNGAERIAAERQRQIDVEGWTPEHDEVWIKGQLARAAECYIHLAALQIEGIGTSLAPPRGWPWDSEWWKPSNDPQRNLEKGGALAAAQIDRCNRFPKRRLTVPDDVLSDYERKVLTILGAAVVDDRLITPVAYERLVKRADSYLVGDYAARLLALSAQLKAAEKRLDAQPQSLWETIDRYIAAEEAARDYRAGLLAVSETEKGLRNGDSTTATEQLKDLDRLHPDYEADSC